MEASPSLATESSEQANRTAPLKSPSSSFLTPWISKIAEAPEKHYALDQGVEKGVAGELGGVMGPIPPLAAG